MLGLNASLDTLDIRLYIPTSKSTKHRIGNRLVIHIYRLVITCVCEDALMIQVVVSRGNMMKARLLRLVCSHK